MKLTYAAIFYGPRSIPIELPAEWQEFEDGADFDLDALMGVVSRISGHPAVLTRQDVAEMRIVAEGAECYIPPKTVVSGNGYMLVWSHGDIEQYVRSIEEA